MSLQTGERLGPYEVIGPLGAGGMGEVWRAWDTRVDRAVALKVLPEEFFESEERRVRFEREAKLLASLNHPGIATLYSFEEISGSSSSAARHVLAMELIEGETLRALLASRPPLRQVLDLGAQVAEALATAHEAGIVHRDLKPENVMVTKSGRIKILDFGLARKTVLEPEGSRAATATAALTETGFIVGTAAYMSPEQARGEAVDFRSDQFALGAILYEMLADRRAFARPTSPQTLAAIIEDEPEPLPAVAPKTPAPLRWVVERCLSKNPASRYESTRDLARELATLRDRIGDLASSGSDTAGPVERRRIRPLVLALGLAGAAATAGFLAGRKASHGVSPPIRFEQVTFGQAGIWLARFAPDGSVVYSAPGGSRDESGVPVHELFIARPGTPESRPLGIPGNILAISRSGEMAILQTKTYFGPGTLAVAPLGGGAPREVLENVMAQADWSPDGHSLAVLHSVEGKVRLEFPVGRPLLEATGFGVAVSPDGRLVTLVVNGGVTVVDLEGHARVLGQWPYVSGLGWSTDGRSMWIFRPVGINTEIFNLHLDGTRRVAATIPGDYYLHDRAPDGRILAERSSPSYVMRGVGPEGRERDLGWLNDFSPAGLSADGGLVLFGVFGAGGGESGSVYVRGTQGSPPKRIASGSAVALSRDGKWALCNGKGGVPPLRLVPTGPGQTKSLDAGAITAYGPGGFHPDGVSVWFIGVESGHPASCYVQSISGGPPRLLAAGVARVRAVSPDGSDLAVAVAATEIPQFVSAETGARRPVPGGEPGEEPIGWSADGRSFYVRSGRLPVTVQRIDLATGRRQKVIQVDLDEGYPPDTFTFFSSGDGRSWVYGAQRFSSDLFIIDGLR